MKNIVKKLLIISSFLFIAIVSGVITSIFSLEKHTYHAEFEPYSDAWLTMDVTYFGESFPDEQSKEAFDADIKGIVWILEEDPYEVGQVIQDIFESHHAAPEWLNAHLVIKGGKITLFEQNFFPQEQASVIAFFAGICIILVLAWALYSIFLI